MRRRRSQRPSGPIPVSPYRPSRPLPRWRRRFGCLCLLSAIGLAIAAAYLVVSAPPITVASPVLPTDEASDQTPTLLPETIIAKAEPTVMSQDVERPPAMQPTISPAQILALLATPPDPAAVDVGLGADPFTLITIRARSKMTSYIAQRGDTIAGIANRYGLKKESIAWCNDYRLALVLRPGDVVNIPPVDGACHTVIRTQSKDIRAIAEQYKVDDPYAIIDSPANELPDIAPETLLPSGTRLFIPGGEGEIITWNAPVQQDGAGNVVAFDPGSPYSCGARSGGGTRWVNPLAQRHLRPRLLRRAQRHRHFSADRHANLRRQRRSHPLRRLEQLGLWHHRRHRPRTLVNALRPHEQPRGRLRPGRRGGTGHRLRRQHRQLLRSPFAFRDSFSQSAARSSLDIGDWLVAAPKRLCRVRHWSGPPPICNRFRMSSHHARWLVARQPIGDSLASLGRPIKSALWQHCSAGGELVRSGVFAGDPMGRVGRVDTDRRHCPPVASTDDRGVGKVNWMTTFQTAQEAWTALNSGDDAEARAAAIVYLGERRYAPAVPRLTELVRQSDPGTRYLAAKALGQIGDEAEAAVPTLLEALRDNDMFLARGHHRRPHQDRSAGGARLDQGALRPQQRRETRRLQSAGQNRQRASRPGAEIFSARWQPRRAPVRARGIGAHR